MNVQRFPIRELALYKFKPGHNATEAAKNICYMKSEGSLVYRTVIGLFLKKNLNSGYENFDQIRSDKPKTMDSEGSAPSH